MPLNNGIHHLNIKSNGFGNSSPFIVQITHLNGGIYHMLFFLRNGGAYFNSIFYVKIVSDALKNPNIRRILPHLSIHFSCLNMASFIDRLVFQSILSRLLQISARQIGIKYKEQKDKPIYGLYSCVSSWCAG